MPISRVSVALCTYNGQEFLREQLESIARQTLRPAELVVSDDQSTDRTPDILESFRRQASFPVRILSNPHRLGVAKNFERAISECSGDVIALADQDDVWLPEKLETMSRFFQDHPNDTAVFSDAELINDHEDLVGCRLSEAQKYPKARLRRTPKNAWLLDILLVRNICTGATMALRRELRSAALPFPDPMPGGILHDAWIALIAALHRQIAYIDKPLILYRQHVDQELGANLPPNASLPQRLSWSLPERQQYLRSRATISRQLCNVIGERFGNLPGTERFKEYVWYVEARSQLPHRRSSRVQPVVHHLLNGNYRRYSSGLVTALRDLM